MFAKESSGIDEWKRVLALIVLASALINLILLTSWQVYQYENELRNEYQEPLPHLAEYELKITTYQGDVANGRYYCDHILVHSANEEFERGRNEWITWQQEWMTFFPNDCFLFVRGDPRKLPTYLEAHEDQVSKGAWREMERRNNGKRVRYDTGVYLTQLAASGYIRRRTGKGIPWVLYTDVDVVFTNKSRGVSSILDRLDEGLRLGSTTEDRVCDDPNFFPCVPQQPRANLTRDDIVLVIAVDNDCQETWMLNSGSQLWQLGRTHGWLMEADLTLFNDTTLRYSFDHFEQGKLALLIREVFDFDFNRLRALCAPFEASVWMPSIEKNEIIVLREFNYTKAIAHPILGAITHKWFPHGLVSDVPRYVALVNARWMNSFACAYNWGFSPARIEATVLHCGDFMGHFNGCHKNELKFRSFRKVLGATPECIKDLPFITMGKSNEPFNYEKWLAEGTNETSKRRVQEPKARIQRDY